MPVNASYLSRKDEGTRLRNDQLYHERRLGTKEWKQLVGYHRRSSVESDIGAFKHTFGDRIHAVTEEHTQCEVAVRVALQQAWKTHVVK